MIIYIIWRDLKENKGDKQRWNKMWFRGREKGGGDGGGGPLHISAVCFISTLKALLWMYYSIDNNTVIVTGDMLSQSMHVSPDWV